MENSIKTKLILIGGFSFAAIELVLLTLVVGIS